MASTIIGGATLAALSAAPAFAQQAPAAPAAAPTVQEVVVTGSRIPHPGLTSVSPLTTVGSQDIKLQGVQNVEDLINSLPQAMASFGAMESNGASGTATVNLRGLGDVRTLVLIDGKRVQPGDTNDPVVDLNLIPSALVDRVDVVTGGASAVYGSDAVAGVVNFIMKKDFEGLRIDVQYGFDQHDQHNSQIDKAVHNSATVIGNHIDLPTGSLTDGGRTSVSIVGGANAGDGNGNVTFYFNYQHSDAVLEKARDFTACSLSTNNTATTFQYCGGSSTAFPGRFTINNPANPNFKSNYTIDGSGNVIPFTNAALYNFAPLNYLQRPDERYTAGEFSHYQLNPHIDIYSSFMFMHDESVAQIAGSGAFFADPYFINCGNNPLLTASEQGAFCAGVPSGSITPLEIGRRDVEGIGRVNDIIHTEYRYVIGARGEITDGWNYDVYAQYGATDIESDQTGYFSIAKTNNALDVISDGHGGIECADATARAAGCVPWNIFNNPAFPGGVTKQQLNYLETDAQNFGKLTEQVVSANITGDLSKYGIKSPWAKDGVGINVGVEYRRETLAQSFDGEFATGDLAGLGGNEEGTSGAFDVKEAFGEIRVPIVQDMAFAKEITFEGGYRYADYSSSGGVDAYKAALDWQINPDIRLRGSFERAVRAPNVNELFHPTQFDLTAGTDPCAGATPQFTAAQCLNTGVSAAQYGTIDQCVSSQCSSTNGGNPALKPEVSDTKSLGFVLTPTFIPGFNLSVDWFDISVKGVIESVPLTAIFKTCADDPTSTLTVLGTTQTFCSLIDRNPVTGIVFGQGSSGGHVEIPFVNGGLLHTEGVDVEGNYRVSLSDWGMGDHGSLVFNLLGTYTEKLVNVLPTNGGTYDCAGLFGTTCGEPTPKWRHKLRVTWVTPWNLSLSAQWRYVSGSALDFNTNNPALHNPLAPDIDDAHIPAYNYLDLSGEWRIRDHIVMHAGVNNVFDKDPPIVDSNSFGISAPPFGNGNTYPQVYDALGRTIFIGITADF
ncbi:MAG TPA: TonB-dependent receptor [Caulobacteraceae bacterium]|jgi:outer membrane receptor protein involved in Fe transport